MKIIKLQDLERDPQPLNLLVAALERGGLVCLPCRGSYRIVADLANRDAVNNLIQSKRRTSKAPSLVFVADLEQLQEVTGEVSREARKLSARFWPGPLTILFSAHPEMPSKIARELTQSTGKIGARIPNEPATLALLRQFGGPLLVSSANRSNKHGESSPAQIQKNFMGRVDFFVDAGDLPPAPPSTVVDIVNGSLQITRQGEISAEALLAAL